MLDVVRTVGKQTGPLPPGMLVVEHGGLMGDRIADAAELGVHITVQQALLDAARGGTGRLLGSRPDGRSVPAEEAGERRRVDQSGYRSSDRATGSVCGACTAWSPDGRRQGFSERATRSAVTHPRSLPPVRSSR
jgi:hypothetical protein